MCTDTSTLEVPWHAFINELDDKMVDIMNSPIEPPIPAEHVSTADQFLLRAIETMGSTITHQLAEINTRLDKTDMQFEKMVTQEAFKAEIRRLDRENEILEQDVNNLGSALRDSKAELESDARERQTKMRWFVGVFTSAIAVAATIVFGILNATGT